MPQMSPAPAAHHFGLAYPKKRSFRLHHILLRDRLRKTGPPGPGGELRFGIEHSRPTTNTEIDPIAVEFVRTLPCRQIRYLFAASPNRNRLATASSTRHRFYG